MSTIRSILLHLDATAGSAARLAVTQVLAERLGAGVTALFGVRPDPNPGSFAYSASAAIRAAEEGGAAPHEHERSQLRLRCDASKVAFVWCEVFGDVVTQAFLAESAYADLLILGRPGGADAAREAPPGFVESVILESGVPAIVIPHPHRQEAFGRRMLVAWDGSAPSARAMRAALPFMAHAAEVHVVTWGAHPLLAPCSHLDASGWLKRHGIGAEVHQRAPTHHVANELAAMATRLQADLVVMGCYGHGRLRERMFGGVTKGALASLPVPVLMAH